GDARRGGGGFQRSVAELGPSTVGVGCTSVTVCSGVPILITFRFVLLRRSPAFHLGIFCLGIFCLAPFQLRLFCFVLSCLSFFCLAIAPAICSSHRTI